jgi:hypothetical protein
LLIFEGIFNVKSFGLILIIVTVYASLMAEIHHLNNKRNSPVYYLLVVSSIILLLVFIGPKCTYNQAKSHLSNYLLEEYGTVEFVNEGEFRNSGWVVKTHNPVVRSFYAFLVKLEGEEVLVFVDPMNKKIHITDYFTDLTDDQKDSFIRILK